jgi:molybdopterin-guanine dinucleotide biosynthesis protein A
MAAKIIPVILCGGGGTRLWPVSRESLPKQFVPLIGQGSTFQQVMTRISDVELFARPIVITNSEFRFVVAEQLRDCAISADIVLEPSRRDSGPAVAIATALASERDPQALVLVLAADHIIRKLPDFLEACRRRPNCGAWPNRDVRHPADLCRDQLRQYPSRRASQWRFCAGGRCIRRKTRRGDGKKIRCRPVSLEQRKFPFLGCNNVGRDVSRGLNPSAASSSFSPVGCNGR